MDPSHSFLILIHRGDRKVGRAIDWFGSHPLSLPMPVHLSDMGVWLQHLQCQLEHQIHLLGKTLSTGWNQFPSWQQARCWWARDLFICQNYGASGKVPSNSIVDCVGCVLWRWIVSRFNVASQRCFAFNIWIQFLMLVAMLTSMACFLTLYLPTVIAFNYDIIFSEM